MEPLQVKWKAQVQLNYVVAMVTEVNDKHMTLCMFDI